MTTNLATADDLAGLCRRPALDEAHKVMDQLEPRDLTGCEAVALLTLLRSVQERAARIPKTGAIPLRLELLPTADVAAGAAAAEMGFAGSRSSSAAVSASGLARWVSPKGRSVGSAFARAHSTRSASASGRFGTACRMPARRSKESAR